MADGEFLSIVGPSGCGKSTLLRIVADLVPPTSGTVEVNGKPARQARRDRDFGIVFQTPVLYEWRSITRNVQLPLELMGYSAADRKERARQMLELVGLSGFEKHLPWQLSGGMQQRVSIARALSFEPSLLLMDEPFGALDEITRDRMNMELQRIWMETSTSVLFITHSIAEAVFLSDRVLVMSSRPGTIDHEVDIPLPRPRTEATREQDDFFHLSGEIRARLRRPGGVTV
jgi:NitT/TauT family transport system ATP-binding protein